MTSNPARNTPQTSQPPGARLKQLAFAFPFLRKGHANAGTSAQFTDEHDIYRLLAGGEPSGSYLVSRKGMWHGGIHVTEAGSGQAGQLHEKLFTHNGLRMGVVNCGEDLVITHISIRNSANLE